MMNINFHSKKRLQHSISQIVFITFILLHSSQTIAKKNETIQFTFSPGNTHFKQTVIQTREKIYNNKVTHTEKSTSIAMVSATKTKTGWRLVTKPIFFEIRRDQSIIRDPIINTIAKKELTYELDNNGHIINIQGYHGLAQEIENKVKNNISSDTLKQINSMFNENVLKEKVISEWNSQIGNYIGRQVKIGDSFFINTPLLLPNGSTKDTKVKVTFLKMQPCDKSHCVLIQQSFYDNADDLSKMAGKMIRDKTMASQPDIPFPSQEHNSGFIEWKTERLIDPKTMLVHGETTTRMMNMKINVPKLGYTPLIMKEKKIYRFEY